MSNPGDTRKAGDSADTPRRDTLGWRVVALIVVICFLVTTPACVTPSSPSDNQWKGTRLGSDTGDPPSQDSSRSPRNDSDDAHVLASIWQARTADGSDGGDFVLGPGDVLRISLPQLEHLKDNTVRVSEDDTISLPLLGVITVKGMTQENLRRELAQRVEKYVYKPQVSVYLEHSENQLVAVLGAVKKPGRYMLTTNSNTLMTMISRAGGTTKDAASRIIFIPAPASTRTAGGDGGSATMQATPEQLSARQTSISNGTLRQPRMTDSVTAQMLAEGVVIDCSHPANQRYLALPARSGDVIIVPAAGQVTVQGWVDKPGAFPITPDMTVLSAVAAAGGALFTSSATLLRDEGSGNKLAVPLDLSRIKAGAAADVPVRGGDVIIVNRSVAGALPYSLYFLINHTGVGLPVVPF